MILLTSFQQFSFLRRIEAFPAFSIHQREKITSDKVAYIIKYPPKLLYTWSFLGRFNIASYGTTSSIYPERYMFDFRCIQFPPFSRFAPPFGLLVYSPKMALFYFVQNFLMKSCTNFWFFSP